VENFNQNNNQKNLQSNLPKRPEASNKSGLPKRPDFQNVTGLPKRPDFLSNPKPNLPKKPNLIEKSNLISKPNLPKKPDLPKKPNLPEASSKPNLIEKSDLKSNSSFSEKTDLKSKPNLPKKPDLPKKPVSSLPKKPEYEPNVFEEKPKKLNVFDEEPKKPLLKNRKFWAVFLAGFILASSMVLGIFHTITINAKIQTPSGLQVYSLSNGEIYVQVDKNDRAVNYQFLISYNEGEPQGINSPTNALNVSDLINIVGEYAISCKIIGLAEPATSDYCESITYLKKTKILTPLLSLNSNENRLEFNLMDHFIEDVSLNFLLCYGADDEGTFLYNEEFTIVSDDNSGTVYGYFELDFLPAGEYSLSVKVEAVDNEFYLSSNLTTQIEYVSIV